MVFKPIISSIARQLSVKSLAHGYAQSVVAASQSSFASQTAFPLAWKQNGPPKAFKAYSGANAGGRADYSTSFGGHSSSGSQYAAFHNNHDDEWQHRQPLHQRRLVPVNVLAKEGESSDGLSKPAVKKRSASMSCVRDFSTSAQEGQAEDTAVLSQISGEELIPNINNVSVDQPQQQQAAERQAVTEEEAIANATASAAAEPNKAAQAAPESSDAAAATVPSPTTSSPEEESRTSTSSAEALNYAAEDASSDLSGQTLVNISSSSPVSVDEYIKTMDALKVKSEFEQIRDLFHSLLKKGVTPTTALFDYLLHAVTQLPMTGRERLASLESYYDHMVSLSLLPSSYTYSILISAFADGAETDTKLVKEYEAVEKRNGGFLMPSERQLLDEARASTSMETAMALFAAGSELNHRFSDEAFNILILGCAQRNEIQSLVSVLGYMESLGATPTLEAYGEMIRAFGRDQDMSSAIDCYKTAIAQAKGLKTRRLIFADGLYREFDGYEDDRARNTTFPVYLNMLLAQAYVLSGKEAEALQFVENAARNGYESGEDLVYWLANAFLMRGDLDGSLRYLDQLSPENLKRKPARVLFNEVCGALADAGRADEALARFQQLAANSSCSETSTVSMVAMYLRLGDLDSARAILDVAIHKKQSSSVQLNNLATLFALKAIEAGRIDEGLEYYVMGVLESSVINANLPEPVTVNFSEGISVILSSIDVNGTLSQLQSLALMNLYDGLRIFPEIPVARRLLAPFEGVPPEALTAEHFNLLVLVQSVVAQAPDATSEEVGKLEYMLDHAMQNRLPLWNFPASMVEKREPLTGIHNLTLEEHVLHSPFNLQAQYKPTEDIGSNFSASVAVIAPPLDPDRLFEDHDPYAEGLNIAKSQSLHRFMEERSRDKSERMYKARQHVVAAFQGLSGTKTHFQPHVVAKALQFVVKDSELLNSQVSSGPEPTREKERDQWTLGQLRTIFSAALAPIPFLPESKKVRYAWYIIYDAMISACLQINCVAEAEEYRDQMLQLGASPSANTYGLFIVNLKSHSPSYDEATEAVKIFERAKRENVTPSSFLYNALIGKLSKARRIDDCLMYFSEMRALGIRPTSVTYGTIVNALCRVSDQRFAEELFEEMESMPNYKPRPAPYNSMIQYFTHSKQDQARALEYYNRMLEKGIKPSNFTYKLVLDAYCACEPHNTDAALALIDQMKKNKIPIFPIHYGSLIFGLGVKQLNLEGARTFYQSVINNNRNLVDQSIFQSWAEALTANGKMEEADKLKAEMKRSRIRMTPYIANALINGWSAKGEIKKAEVEYNSLIRGEENLREPSTYEAMAKAYETVGDHDSAMAVLNEMAGRMYPAPVLTKVMDIVRADGKYEAALID